MAFWKCLIDHDEFEVDSLIVSGLVAMTVLCGLETVVTLVDIHTFSPITFATGAGTILGAIAGGKGMRDKLSGPPRGNDVSVSLDKPPSV